VKFLFDENLSHRLVPMLEEIAPGSVHPRNVNLLGASDDEIWRYAREQDFLIVSKDDDFRQRAMLFGPPPKVVWLVVGNAGTNEIAAFLRKTMGRVREFVADKETSVLILRPQAPDSPT
jgi:predicted nuclease of predicted toxin-antitoxin system